MKKFSIKIIVTILILSILISWFPNNAQAATQKIDSKISNIDNKKYPGIKSMIQTLQKQHPNWNFKVLYTGLNWNTVIKEESKHGTNLTYKTYTNWICPTCGNKGYSGSSWLCASSSAIAYMMDPRNSLYYEDVFQFLELSYDANSKYDANIIKNILKDSFLDDGKLNTYANTIIARCKEKDVNPYYIAGKIIQEQGKKGGSTWKMKVTENDKTVYYYNIFNINAKGTTTSAILNNALIWAKAKKWNTIEKCLIGGVDFIANGYITAGQDTMYFEKFDVVGDENYSHQYATDVMYAQNQGEKMRRMLESVDATEYAYTFVIPLYENMPASACPRPTASSSSASNNANSNTTTNTSDTYDLGDLDNNNKIDAMDMYNMIQYILGKVKLKEQQINAADLNKDGKIDAMDMYMMIQKIKKD